MRSPWQHSAQVPVYITNISTREASNPLGALPGPALTTLLPFAADPASAIRQIQVRVSRPAAARLALEYELVGDLARVRLGQGGPAASADSDRPTDGLWRHTCMEVFVGHATGGPYLEYNLAPAGEWAAYRFSGYRAGMSPLTGIRAPRIELRTQSDRVLLCAEVAIPAELTGNLRLGISAVVEDSQGQLGYWALRHAGGRPDFHHPDSFGFEI
ncbi:MAG TPA: DOMON-like domain-containing protein [Steroidobacteraceae bacterium]|nr:DOMON-like domain-containing protein [Steroidobacteraceae bacterium]